MIELGKPSLLKVRIFDKEYELKKPTIRQVNKMQDEMKKAQETGNSVDVLCDFFESLGLPRDVVLDLDVDSVTKLSEYVSGVEKKS